MNASEAHLFQSGGSKVTRQRQQTVAVLQTIGMFSDQTECSYPTFWGHKSGQRRLLVHDFDCKSTYITELPWPRKCVSVRFTMQKPTTAQQPRKRWEGGKGTAAGRAGATVIDVPTDEANVAMTSRMGEKSMAHRQHPRNACHSGKFSTRPGGCACDKSN